MRNMKERFEKLTGGGAAVSVVMIVFGLVLLLWPGHTLELAARIVGVGLLVGGAVLGVTWYRDRRAGRISGTTLAEAIVALVGGVLLLAAPKTVVSIVPVAVGIVIAVNGLVNLTQALELRRISVTRWQGPLVLAILTILAGALLIFNPLKPIEWAVMAIGAVLIFNGASNLFISHRYKKYH